MTTLPLRTLALLALTPALAADTFFVDADLVTGLDDGSSWADAFQGSEGLQDALALAVAGDEVWVAAGTYIPSQLGQRGVSFQPLNGVAVYGGFVGGESSPAERPPLGDAPSVLGGDLNGDDVFGFLTDNSFHVVRAVGTDASTILDGFTVRGGEATTNGSNRDRGGGILCLGPVGMTVRNCVFRDNRSSFGGAHGYVNNGGFPTFTDVRFLDGSGGLFGGAFDIASGGPVRYERCHFEGNVANRGGALEIFATSGVIVSDCVFRDNVANSDGGGAIWMGSGGNTRVRNCTIVSNDSLVNAVGGLRNQGANNATVRNCIFWNNAGPGGVQNPGNQVNAATDVEYSLVEGGFGGGGVGNIAADPQFVDLAGGDYRLGAASPAIDAGNSGEVLAGITVDHDGLPRMADVLTTVDTGAGGAPVVDMGAHESPSVWLELGQGLAGVTGEPDLLLAGTLLPGSQVDFSLSNAAPSSTAYFVLGLSLLQAPFKGGTMVPFADLVVPLPTDPTGDLAFSAQWPANLPAGVLSIYQYWIEDAAGPAGFSASNAVQGVTP